MKFYTVNEVASILQYDVQTIRRKIREKNIKAVKIGKEYRVSQAELDRILRGE